VSRYRVYIMMNEKKHFLSGTSWLEDESKAMEFETTYLLKTYLTELTDHGFNLNQYKMRMIGPNGGDTRVCASNQLKKRYEYNER